MTDSADTPLPPVARAALTCVIVEDQSMFRDLLATTMALWSDIRIVARAHDVATGRAACEQHKPDVLILDLALPDGDGIDVARRFVEIAPRGQVIVVTGQASEFVCPTWLNRNLHALLSKNEAFDTLRRELDALTGASTRAEAGPKDSTRTLTDREAELFGLIGDGLSTRQIAERLGLSAHTVQTHRRRIATKLGTTGDELVRRAVTHRARSFTAEPR